MCYDQKFFFPPKAEPVFAITNKLFIRIDHINIQKVLNSQCRFSWTIDQEHIKVRCVLSVYNFACLKPTSFQNLN